MEQQRRRHRVLDSGRKQENRGNDGIADVQPQRVPLDLPGLIRHMGCQQRARTSPPSGILGAPCAYP